MQGAQDEIPPKLFFLFRCQLRISGWADDPAGGHGAERAYFFRHRYHSTDLHHRYLQSFDFFANRCAAASARASGRSEDDAGNAGGLQSLGNALADAGRILHGGVGAAGGMDGFMELADDSLLFQITHNVEGHESVRILIGESGVVAGMNDVEFLWVQPV